jgi:phosphatidylinositol alpha-1,6-mannosyltransferase
MERLNARMFEALHSRNASSVLLGPAGACHFAPEGACSEELAGGSLLTTILSSITRGARTARRTRPRVVLAGSGLAAPAAVISASLVKAVPIVYLHGLDIVARSPAYRMLWLPCIKRCSSVLVNSANTRRLAIHAGVADERIHVVHPGTTIPLLDPHARDRFRARHGIDASAPLLLSVGRLTARKGIAEFVARGLPLVQRVHPGVRLLIIGDEAPQALHRGKGAGIERVYEAARVHGVETAVEWLGPCTDAELADAYQAADVHVFPGRDIPGDVEGFGMVAIEAAAHGLPTVAFDVGGVADAVSEGVSGLLVPPGNDRAYANAVNAALAQTAQVHRERARRFAASFSWERFGQEVADVVMSAA